MNKELRVEMGEQPVCVNDEVCVGVGRRRGSLKGLMHIGVAQDHFRYVYLRSRYD